MLLQLAYMSKKKTQLYIGIKLIEKQHAWTYFLYLPYLCFKWIKKFTIMQCIQASVCCVYPFPIYKHGCIIKWLCRQYTEGMWEPALPGTRVREPMTVVVTITDNSFLSIKYCSQIFKSLCDFFFFIVLYFTLPYIPPHILNLCLLALYS